MLPNNTELELIGIKFKNGFNVEIPNDILHINPGLRFNFSQIIINFLNLLEIFRQTAEILKPQ